LSLSDVYLVVGYYLQNKAEVDAYVDRQQQLADEARYAYEAQYANDPLRERLLARVEASRRQAGVFY
jgi:hypothetical protein